MALHSRAFLLLRWDLINLQRYPISGISASPNGDDLFHWNAKIQGLGGTVWEGGVFQVKLSFNEDFNSRPPEIHFMTIPFHPNVDPTDGTPVIHQLMTSWSEECSVLTVLLALQAMLSDPELDSGCIAHVAASQIYVTAPHTYRQMALDCITASLRIDAGLPPHENDEELPEIKPLSLSTNEGKRPETQSRQSKRRRAMPISFDDYHALWKGIATSITSYRQQDTFIELLDRDKHLNRVHSGAAKLQHNTIDLEQKLKEHIVLKYGTGNPRNRKSVKQKDPRARIEELKMMYRNASTINNDAVRVGEGEQVTERGSLTIRDDSVWPQGMMEDDDVDDLVQWTRELDEQQLTNA